MKPTLRLSLLVSLTMALTASAGTFTNSFDSGSTPAGTAVYGVAIVDTTGGPDGSGCLKMTSAVNSVEAGFILNDLDAGAQITGFTANFQLEMGGGSTTPADGFSFNFASDVPDSVISEEGAPTTGFTVEFDTYNNGAPDAIGIDLKWKNSEFATFPWDVTNLITWPAYVPVKITMSSGVTTNAMYSNAVVTVTFNGTNIYTTNRLSNFLPFQGRFGLGARSGSVNQNTWVDNLGITTTVVPRPYVQSDAPTGTNIRPDPTLTVVLSDTVPAKLNQGNIYMQLNGVPVTPTITPASPLVTLTYSPPFLPSGSTNNVLVSFLDSSSSVRQTNQFTFVVATYPTIPASYRATADTGSPGFTQRIFQGGTATVNSIANAENLLGGFLINPAAGLPFPNTAQPNFDSTWTFPTDTILNYNIYAPTNAPGTDAGNFTGDLAYPGMPGTNGSLVNFAYEAITYLDLSPGVYTFGVNSDDGFRLMCLDKQVGVYDAGRPAADSIFYFVITQAGYYPFRLVHFQGTSAASLEWFSVNSAGTKVLINQAGMPEYIPAYRSATTSLPYFLGSWPSGTGNRPDQPIRVQIQDGANISVNTNTIRLTVNGVNNTPSITQAGGVTTLQYSGLWASASVNTAVVWFADSELTPVSQTNQFTFSVSTYTSLPSSYALSAAAVDTTKPGFAQKVFQTDHLTPYTIANAEVMLAGQLGDAFGHLYPNKAATNTDGTWNFTQTNVLNYNLAAPAAAGNFSGDLQFPGMPGAGGNTNMFALEAITYLYLPVGYYSLGVNSDDGFRLTTSPNPREVFPYQVAVFDGTRGAADTTAGFGITQAGYYPFRLVYFQATSPASLELFSVAVSGQRILVNDTNTPGCIRAYRSANNPQPYVQTAYPYRTENYFASANNPIGFSLVDGTPAIQLNTIQLTFNGTVVTPTVSRVNGTNVVVSFDPSAYVRSTNFTAAVQLVWADAAGHYNTNVFSFTLHGSESLQPLWTLPPGSRSYLTATNKSNGSGAQQAGLAYNPVTHHLVLGSITNFNGIPRFSILDPSTGNDLGQLKLTNASGTAIFTYTNYVYFAGYMVGVADDGAIYAADKRTSTASTYLYRIYRWGSEGDFVSLAYSDGSLPLTLGDNFCVRGAGTNTQILAGGGSSYAQAVLFTTANGTNFTASQISPISDILLGDLFGGIAFGTSNIFYTEGLDPYLWQVSFDPVAKTGSALASYALVPPAGALRALGVDLANGRMVALATSSTNGIAHSVNLFDLNSLSTSSYNYPVDTSPVPTANTNLNLSGSVAFASDGSMAFVLDTENGIMAYGLSIKSSLAATRIGGISGTTLSYSGGAGSQFVLLRSATANAAMISWARIFTNSATPGNFTIPAPGPGPAVFYRVSSE